MKHKTLRFGKGFRVTFGNRRCQAAEMVIEPGGAEGGPKNRHRGAGQWLFVVWGRGVALIKGSRYPLKTGTLLLIEHADQHEIRNTGRGLLKTLLHSRCIWRPTAQSSYRAARSLMSLREFPGVSSGIL